MRKEIILAIIIGLSLGLLLTFGIYRAGSSLTRRKTTPDVAQNLVAPSPTAAANPLTIISPEDEIVQTARETTVAGATAANSYIVIFVNDEEYISSADSSGNFSVKVDLELGSNILITHALDEAGVETVEERTLIVSADAATASPSASVAPTASPAGATR
ncbi:MAG: hypothetical protein M3Q81_00755 [bacterium]|nr:hypothetical protein [bacterium]